MSAVVGVHTGVLPGGGIGVLIFFVLSGFLITSLILHERGETGRVSLKLFYARRALRLLPALAVMVAAACAVALARPHWPLSHDTLHFAPAAILYYGNWLRAAHPYFVGGTLAHTWSLSVEEQFYIVWAVLLAALLAGGARLRTIATIALAGAVLSDAGKLLLWSGGSLVSDANRMYGSDLSGDALMLGCALAVAVLARPALTLRITRILVWPAVVFLFVVIVFVHPLVGTFAQAREFEAIVWPLCNVAAAVVIGHLALAPRAPLAWILSLRPLRGLGRISYGVYLWHYPILIWLFSAFGFKDRLWQLPIQVGAALAAAILSYNLVERRALALKNRLRPREPALPAVGQPQPAVEHTTT